VCVCVGGWVYLGEGGCLVDIYVEITHFSGMNRREREKGLELGHLYTFSCFTTRARSRMPFARSCGGCGCVCVCKNV
jgi:hypothetical protein